MNIEFCPLTHFRLNKPNCILEESNSNFRHVRISDLDIPREKMAELFANSGDINQTLQNGTSGMGLHCLSVTLLRVSRLKWVNNFKQTLLSALFHRFVCGIFSDYTQKFSQTFVYKDHT